jgi:hypothetical protein
MVPREGINRMTYVAITLHFWGKGASQEVALKNMKDAGGRGSIKSHGYVIVETDDDGVQIDQIDGGVLIAQGKTATVIVDKRKKKLKKAVA